MRILLTTDTIGGVWTFTQELTAGLLRRGHAVTLASFGQMPSAAQQEWLQQTRREHAGSFEELCTPVPLEWMEKNESAYETGARFLLGLTAQSDFNILHSNQFCFGALPVDMPRLVTAHSDVLSWGEACRTPGLEKSLWLTTYLHLVDGGLRGAHAVTAPSRWMLQALTRLYPHVPERQQVIPNGRTLEPQVDPAERMLQAVSVGRLWDEGKNIGLLAHVRSPMPLLVAGDRQMESSAAPAALGEAVLLGALRAEDLHALFRRSALYIATSIYEPFGLAPLEAALCGCALLLNDVPSLRELWGDHALYFGNAEELSGLLQQLARTPDQLARQQRLAIERARSFSAERMVGSYLSLYADLTDAYRAGRKQSCEATYVQ